MNEKDTEIMHLKSRALQKEKQDMEKIKDLEELCAKLEDEFERASNESAAEIKELQVRACVRACKLARGKSSRR